VRACRLSGCDATDPTVAPPVVAVFAEVQPVLSAEDHAASLPRRVAGVTAHL